MSEIQEFYWLVPPVRADNSRKCLGTISPSTIVRGFEENLVRSRHEMLVSVIDK